MRRIPLRPSVWPSLALLAVVAAGATGCASKAGPGGATATVTASKSSAGPWRSLFDGKSMSAWRGYKMETMPPAWKIVDGMLTKSVPTEDIITREEFSDFELEIDWKLEKGGNSGIFFRATEEYDKVYWSAPEYALLDDANAPDGRRRITSAGAAHSLYEPPAGIVHPFGEWNSSRIIAKGAHVEYWMNGQKLFEFEMGSPDWDARVAASKFKPWANFGKARKGRIAIQGDHNGTLTLRNMRIRELK